MSWLNRLRRRTVLRAPLGDVVLAVVLAAFAFADTFFVDQFSALDQWRGPRAVNAVVVPLAAAALAWRRRFPLTVLAITCVAMDALGFRLRIHTGIDHGVHDRHRGVLGDRVRRLRFRSRSASSPSACFSATRTTRRSDRVGEHIWDWLFVGMFVGIGYGTRLRRIRLSAQSS